LQVIEVPSASQLSHSEHRELQHLDLFQGHTHSRVEQHGATVLAGVSGDHDHPNQSVLEAVTSSLSPQRLSEEGAVFSKKE
jgi:hypothetical protein